MFKVIINIDCWGVYYLYNILKVEYNSLPDEFIKITDKYYFDYNRIGTHKSYSGSQSL